MTVSLPGDLREAGAAIGFFRELDSRLAAIPGVESVGHGTHIPLLGWVSTPPATIWTAEGEVNGNHMASSITESYFATMGILVLQGRPFNAEDREGTMPVAIVSSSMAEMYWPGESPIGKRVRLDLASDSVWRTVVGVAADVRSRVDVDPLPQYYVPFAQAPAPNAWYQVVVAGFTGDPAAIAPQLRGVLRELDPDIPTTIRLMDEGISSSGVVRDARFLITVLGGFAVFAAVLAALGVYGVLAFAVQQRTREIGIRLALGAEQGRVVRGILGRGLTMGAAGLALGSLAVLASGRVIASLLFEVDPGDPWTLITIGALVAAAVLAASFFPALRATSVNPVDVLRGD
jgi:predicted permease